uniref:Uncharacterized protein n=1 Tax=Sphaerodactylus townsendi TaxID=933632 RepID=A0ACB8G445_9SAUR
MPGEVSAGLLPPHLPILWPVLSFQSWNSRGPHWAAKKVSVPARGTTPTTNTHHEEQLYLQVQIKHSILLKMEGKSALFTCSDFQICGLLLYWYIIQKAKE